MRPFHLPDWNHRRHQQEGASTPAQPGNAAGNGHDTVTPGKPPARFTHRVRELFAFLVVLVAVTNLSSILLLDKVVRNESQQATQHLNHALDELRLLYLRTPADARDDLNLDSLAREHEVGHLKLTVRTTRDGREFEWRSTATGPAPPVNSKPNDPSWVTVTRPDNWAGNVVIASAAISSPRLAALREQFEREIWTRALVMAVFGIFVLLFYRYIFLPFRDMRRRAAALVDSGVLPDDIGSLQEDPEYVMGAFDELAHRLLERADAFKRQAVYSERRARDLERFNEFMLASLTTGVVIISREGEVLHLNPSAQTILSVDGDAVAGLPCRDAGFAPEIIAIVDEGLRDGYVYSRREVRIEQTDGENPRYLGVNTSRILDDHGEVIGLSVLFTDLTEIKRLQDELAENERLADLGEMSAGLAHQLRNSTAAILGYGKLLAGRVTESTQRGWVDAIVEETHETEVMLTRFLDFARPLSAEKCALDLCEIAADAIRTLKTLAQEQQVKVSLHSPTSVPERTVIGDALLLKQVIINLLQNAIEAMINGGQVDIAIVRVARQEKGKPTVTITISDTGPGIADDDHTRIFHPFHTSKEQGTGLGLPLAKKIAILHGGNLTLEHSSAAGTTFSLTLPAAPQAQAEARQSVRDAAVSATIR